MKRGSKPPQVNDQSHKSGRQICAFLCSGFGHRHLRSDKLKGKRPSLTRKLLIALWRLARQGVRSCSRRPNITVKMAICGVSGEWAMICTAHNLLKLSPRKRGLSGYFAINNRRDAYLDGVLGITLRVPIKARP